MTLRHQALQAFTESARDSADPIAKAAAVRLYWAINFPRTKGHMATQSDFELLAEFEGA